MSVSGTELKMKKPKVSIIVPVYNAEKYLHKCLDSLIHQTLEDIEIICIDDGSTDSSGQIIDEYAKKDNRIVPIHQNNHGQVYSNKVGLKYASAQYTGFTDADDWAEPDMYEKLFLYITGNDADIVKSGYFTDTEKSSDPVPPTFEEGLYGRADLEKNIYPKMLGYGDFFTWGLFPSKWDALFKTELIKSCIEPEDERIVIGEDLAAVIPAFLKSNRIYITKDCFYHYCQHPESMVKNDANNAKMRLEFDALNNYVSNTLEKYCSVCDLREAWTRYLLFIMLPRTDNLYDGIEDLPYLFPYPNVKKGSDIILYCAGTFGQHLYKYLKRTGFCNVVAWADRNAVEMKKQGMPVIKPDEMKNYDCNQIVVANSFGKQMKGIYKDLSQMFPDRSIETFDVDLILSEDTLIHFRISVDYGRCNYKTIKK